MIPARHTWFHVRFFRWYTAVRLKRNFSTLTVHPPVADVSDKPLLVIGNHFSWWDGFWILWLNHHYLHKKFHVMMLEEHLRKNSILNKTGAFSIRRGSRDAVESLKYARKILEDGSLKNGRTDGSAPTARQLPMILMYPQGEIQSMHTRPVTFEKGLEHITRGLEGKIYILMVVVLVDYFSNQKPGLHFYLELFPFTKKLVIEDIESAFNRFLNRSASNQITGNRQPATSNQ
jgi:1-acyl-sn-glycerol-3-phosphate acyltransferase